MFEVEVEKYVRISDQNIDNDGICVFFSRYNTSQSSQTSLRCLQTRYSLFESDIITLVKKTKFNYFTII